MKFNWMIFFEYLKYIGAFCVFFCFCYIFFFVFGFGASIIVKKRAKARRHRRNILNFMLNISTK